MRTLTLTVAWMVCLVVHGQVHVDVPLHLTATDSTQRQVEGLAAPLHESDLITLGTARQGAVHWGTTGGNATAITLTLSPPAGAYSNGMLVRFLPTLRSAGQVTLNVDGLGAVPLRAHEGARVPWGLLEPGRIAEAIFVDSVFVLRARALQGCPPGYVQANERLCIQAGDGGTNMSFYDASLYCMDRGARLCSWDEYIHACNAVQGQLTGLFDDWEWLDDTSDHTHTADQVGRWNCHSQRSMGATDHPLNHAKPRCCYRIR